MCPSHCGSEQNLRGDKHELYSSIRQKTKYVGVSVSKQLQVVVCAMKEKNGASFKKKNEEQF